MQDSRFKAEDDWIKMQREILNYPKEFRKNNPEAHKKIIIHFNYNKNTDETVNFKFKD